MAPQVLEQRKCRPSCHQRLSSSPHAFQQQRTLMCTHWESVARATTSCLGQVCQRPLLFSLQLSTQCRTCSLLSDMCTTPEPMESSHLQILDASSKSCCYQYHFADLSLSKASSVSAHRVLRPKTLIVHVDATAVRRIVHVDSSYSDYSPSFGYRDTPSLDLTAAQPNSGPSPLPVPAGLLDVTLTYLASSSNFQCANASNTLTSAFLIQVAARPLACLRPGLTVDNSRSDASVFHSVSRQLVRNSEKTRSFRLVVIQPGRSKFAYW